MPSAGSVQMNFWTCVSYPFACACMTGNPSIEVTQWDLNFRVADDSPSNDERR